MGKDGVVRAARLRNGKSYLERAVQQLYPMELTCDDPPVEETQSKLNVDAREFQPKRRAAKVAEEQINSLWPKRTDECNRLLALRLLVG